METWRPWSEPTPRCATGRLEKKGQWKKKWRYENSGIRRSQRKEGMKRRWRWRGGREKGEPKRQGGGAKECELEWAGSLAALKLVKSQSIVLGMKTGRAVCCSQAWDSTLPEKSCLFFFPPNLHSHLLPCPCIHHPIHQPLCSIARPHRSDSTTLSNRPDGLGEIHSNVHIHLYHRNANALLSYGIFKHCLTEITTCEKSRAGLLWGDV